MAAECIRLFVFKGSLGRLYSHDAVVVDLVRNTVCRIQLCDRIYLLTMGSSDVIGHGAGLLYWYSGRVDGRTSCEDEEG